MRKRQRSIGALIGRALLLVVGVVGGLAALDASVVFVFLAMGALLGHRLNPYIGLFMFIAVPAMIAAGAALAYSAYRLMTSRESAPDEDAHEVRV
jgi:hypothetical protein